MSATNGSKTFLYVVQYENSTGIDIIRSDHDPSPEEITKALCQGVEFDPARDLVTRYSEDRIIDIPNLPNK